MRNPLVACAVMAAIAFVCPDEPSPRPLDENGHSDRLAPKYAAEREVRLQDGSRVDLLNDEYAIEVDWCTGLKWAEGCGQALLYAELTGKKPALLLLYKGTPANQRCLWRARTVCARAGIRVFVEEVEE